MQRETVLFLYENQKNNKSQNYDLLNYAIKHLNFFRCFYFSVESKSGVYPHSNSISLNPDLTSRLTHELFDFLSDGDVHISYFPCTKKHSLLLKDVFRLSSMGLSVREISKELGVSLTQVVRCHFIVVNYLANVYASFFSAAVAV